MSRTRKVEGDVFFDEDLFDQRLADIDLNLDGFDVDRENFGPESRHGGVPGSLEGMLRQVHLVATPEDAAYPEITVEVDPALEWILIKMDSGGYTHQKRSVCPEEVEEDIYKMLDSAARYHENEAQRNKERAEAIRRTRNTKTKSVADGSRKAPRGAEHDFPRPGEGKWERNPDMSLTYGDIWEQVRGDQTFDTSVRSVFSHDSSELTRLKEERSEE